MAVSSTTSKVSYSASSSQTVFAYTFKIFADADLKVYVNDVQKTLTTDYTVSDAGETSGGNVTFGTGLTAADSVVIERVLTLTQGTDYVENDPFPAETHEDALDRLTFVTQQHQDALDRSIKFATTVTDAGDVEVLDSAASRANKLFAFDSAGDLDATQEIGVYKGTDATTTTAAYMQRDLVKSTTTAQLNNVYICILASPVGTLLTNTTYWALIVDAITAASSATAAAASAAAALVSENNAQSSEDDAAADLVLTNADVVTTNADVVLTHADVVLTNADVVSAEADKVQTGLDRVATAADKVATNADVVLTAADVVSSAASASTATTQAALATTNGAAQVTLATAQVTLATTQATNAATSATTATTQASAASTSATSAATQATTATTQATAAAASATAAAASADTFDDTYLGAKSSDPTLDNDGDALNAGDLYYNTTSSELKYYSGSAWTAIVTYTHPNHSGDVVSSGDGAMTIQVDAVDIAMLSATGTASSTTFLRGDNTWVVPTDTDTTYTAGDGLALASEEFTLDLTKDQSWTGSQRGTPSVVTDGTLDLNTANNFKYTPAASPDTLEFTNETAGQSGFITVINASGHTIATGSEVKKSSTWDISTAGTYLVSYYSDGTNVYLSASAALAT